MRVLMTSVLLAAALGAGCDGNLNAGGGADLTYHTVEFHRQGGEKCPGDAGVTEENALCATVKFTYPEISSDARPELADKLNRFIRRQLLDTDVAETADPATPEGEVDFGAFADRFIKEYRDDPNTFTSWELERSAEAVYANEKLLTLRFDEFGFTGGAHPFSGSRYAVLKLEDATELELPDLFNPGYEAALNVEGEKAFRAVRDLPAGASLEEQGFNFENNVFALNRNFGVDRDSLRFIFNSYEVAPYAMGPTELAIPYEDIQSLLRPDGLLGAHAN